MLFIVGLFLFFAGDLYTYSYPKLTGAEVEFPSIGDAIYLAVYPPLVAGLLVLVRRRNPQGDRAGVIDSLIISVGIALLSWVFLVAPNIHLSGLTVLEKAVSAAYPLGDILLLAAAVRLAVDNGKRAPAFYLLVGSIVSLLAVDSAYNYRLLTDAYNHQLATTSAGSPSTSSGAQPPSIPRCARWRNRRSSRARGSRPSVWDCSPGHADRPGVRFYQALDDRDVLVLIVASALLFLLVVARMVGLVRQEERAAARELALRRAGVELVAAGGREQVNEAAISAVLALAERPASVRLVLLAGTAPSSPPPPETRASGRCRRLPTRGFATSRRNRTRSPSRSLPDEVRDQLRLDEGSAVLFSPHVRDVTRGLLVLCSPLAHPPRARRLARVGRLAGVARPRGGVAGRGLHRRQSEARFRSLVAIRATSSPSSTPTAPSPTRARRSSASRLPGGRDRGTETSRGCSPRPTGRGWRRSSPVSATPTRAAAPRPT